MRTRLLLPTLAAALALAVTGPVIADHADARPTAWPPPADRGGDALRAENAALRAELARYQAAVDDGLDQLDNVARMTRDRRVAMRLRRTIDDLRTTLRGRDDGGWHGGGWQGGGGQGGGGWQGGGWQGGGRPDGAPRDQPVLGMAGPDYQQLLAAIAAARFPTDQMNVVGAAAPYNRFTVDQVAGIMNAFAFDDARIEIAVLLAPRVVDPARWYLVYDALQFSSSKDALRQRSSAR